MNWITWPLGGELHANEVMLLIVLIVWRSEELALSATATVHFSKFELFPRSLALPIARELDVPLIR
jgi:hypothetical protein